MFITRHLIYWRLLVLKIGGRKKGMAIVAPGELNYMSCMCSVHTIYLPYSQLMAGQRAAVYRHFSVPGLEHEWAVWAVWAALLSPSPWRLCWPLWAGTHELLSRRSPSRVCSPLPPRRLRSGLWNFVRSPHPGRRWEEEEEQWRRRGWTFSPFQYRICRPVMDR